MVHVADDRRERVGDIRCQRRRGQRSDAEARSTDDGDAAAGERLAEGPRGEKRRRERRPAAGAVDDECRERRRLTADEVVLPPGCAALAVVERLVAEDASCDGADPASRDRSGEPVEIRSRERRVAEALEDQIAVPRGTGPRTGAVDLRVEAVARSEARQRGPRDGDLLVRGRCDRERGVVGVDRRAGRDVDGEGGRPAERERRSGERPGQPQLEWRRGCGGRRRRGAGDRGHGQQKRAPNHAVNRRR